MEPRNLFVQGQIGSGDVSIYLWIVHICLHINLQTDAQSLKLCVRLHLSIMSTSVTVWESPYGRTPSGWNSDCRWPGALCWADALWLKTYSMYVWSCSSANSSGEQAQKSCPGPHDFSRRDHWLRWKEPSFSSSTSAAPPLPFFSPRLLWTVNQMVAPITPSCSSTKICWVGWGGWNPPSTSASAPLSSLLLKKAALQNHPQHPKETL